MHTCRESGFARKVEERGDGGAEDIGVEDTAAVALAGERKGEINCFEGRFELDRSQGQNHKIFVLTCNGRFAYSSFRRRHYDHFSNILDIALLR